MRTVFGSPNKKHTVMTSVTDRSIVWQIRTLFFDKIIEQHDKPLYDLTIFNDIEHAKEFYIHCVTHRNIDAKIVKHV
jgi:hypothetical protein